MVRVVQFEYGDDAATFTFSEPVALNASAADGDRPTVGLFAVAAGGWRTLVTRIALDWPRVMAIGSFMLLVNVSGFVEAGRLYSLSIDADALRGLSGDEFGGWTSPAFTDQAFGSPGAAQFFWRDGSSDSGGGGAGGNAATNSSSGWATDDRHPAIRLTAGAVLAIVMGLVALLGVCTFIGCAVHAALRKLDGRDEAVLLRRSTSKRAALALRRSVSNFGATFARQFSRSWGARPPRRPTGRHQDHAQCPKAPRGAWEDPGREEAREGPWQAAQAEQAEPPPPA